jgi:hypothetical protein
LTCPRWREAAGPHVASWLRSELEAFDSMPKQWPTDFGPLRESLVRSIAEVEAVNN